jgi:hypothetical protein
MEELKQLEKCRLEALEQKNVVETRLSEIDTLLKRVRHGADAHSQLLTEKMGLDMLLTAANSIITITDIQIKEYREYEKTKAGLH